MLLSCTFHILSSCTIHILHIHLYVLILSYTLCFRILSVLFLYWFKTNTFISYHYFSYYVNFYLIFSISRRSIRLILLLSYHILFSFIYCTCSYTFFLYFVLSINCHIQFFVIFIYFLILCTFNCILSSHSSAMLLISCILYMSFPLRFHVCIYLRSGYGK